MAASFSFPALGTTWWIELFDDINPAQLAAVKDGCELFLSSFEQRYSRFRTDSLISQLNTHRQLEQPNQDLIAFLQLGQSLYRDTDGAFNMLVGDIMVARGYDAAYSFAPTDHPTPPTLPNPLTDLVITKKHITLTAGSIDVGGYGKGYAIDGLATYLTDTQNCHEFLINGGGDIYGTSEHGRPITIHLEHPTLPHTSIGTTELFHQGFAASSPHKRTWKHRQHPDMMYHHIVSTREPDSMTTHADASFVIAPDAATADAWATVCLVSPQPLPTQLQSLAVSVSESRISIRNDFPFTPPPKGA